jgi:hypothetical protein
MVSQPVKVIALEPLPAYQRVDQVDANQGRYGQPEYVSGAHIRSIPTMSTYRIANIAIPRITAITSMAMIFAPPR